MGYRINISGGQLTDEKASQDWVSTGLAELATGGVDGVRVEVLAERLGVTKGGFYRRFKDRSALLNAMLETWRDGRVAVIERQAEAGGESAVERLRGMFKLYSERANTQGIAIELAIRQWARNRPGRRGGRCKGGRRAPQNHWLALSAARPFGTGSGRPRRAFLYFPVRPEHAVFRSDRAQASQPHRRLRQVSAGNRAKVTCACELLRGPAAR